MQGLTVVLPETSEGGCLLPALLLCCRAPASLRGELLCIPGTPYFVSAAQAMPLDHLALVPGAVCVPGSHRTAAIGERSWQISIARALRRRQTETYAQSSLERGRLGCPGASA